MDKEVVLLDLGLILIERARLRSFNFAPFDIKPGIMAGADIGV
jgi:hypothetical protein